MPIYYPSAITIGLVGFFIALTAVAAALLRSCFPIVWQGLHRAMLLVVLLGLVHGYLIGTETRYGLYQFFYYGLMLTLLLALILRWRFLWGDRWAKRNDKRQGKGLR